MIEFGRNEPLTVEELRQIREFERKHTDIQSDYSSWKSEHVEKVIEYRSVKFNWSK